MAPPAQPSPVPSLYLGPRQHLQAHLPSPRSETGSEVTEQSEPCALPPQPVVPRAGSRGPPPSPTNLLAVLQSLLSIKENPPGRTALPLRVPGVGDSLLDYTHPFWDPETLPGGHLSAPPFSSTYLGALGGLRQHFLQILLKPPEQPGPRPAKGTGIRRAT